VSFACLRNVETLSPCNGTGAFVVKLLPCLIEYDGIVLPYIGNFVIKRRSPVEEV